MIVVAGDIVVNEGTREQAVAAMIAVAHATQQEAGCIRYNFFAHLEDEHHFLVYEEWESQAHLDAHLSADDPPAHMVAFRKANEGVRKASNVKFMTASVNA